MTDRLIPLATVLERTGHMSTTTIWRMRRHKAFPEPVAISPNRKAWRESDIDAWIKARAIGSFDSDATIAA
jgi:predicted DNA-binding transcriptional regulator AlpA